mgnify:CR=1 FL=1
MAESRVSNSIKHLEAWNFFVEEARNIREESDINHLGNFRIPIPDKSGNFIYTETVEGLWVELLKEWYKPRLNSPSIRGKIQYIVNQFKG